MPLRSSTHISKRRVSWLVERKQHAFHRHFERGILHCVSHLRLIFAEKDAKREEMQMFRLEQDALVQQEPSGILKALGRMYGFLSLYGTSATRPAAVLVLSNAIFFVVYLAFALLEPKPVTQPKLTAATHLFKQIFSPFSVWTKDNEPTWIASGQLGLQLLSSVQSLITLAAVALMSVALHWRFRKT